MNNQEMVKFFEQVLLSERKPAVLASPKIVQSGKYFFRLFRFAQWHITEIGKYRRNRKGSPLWNNILLQRSNYNKQYPPHHKIFTVSLVDLRREPFPTPAILTKKGGSQLSCARLLLFRDNCTKFNFLLLSGIIYLIKLVNKS